MRIADVYALALQSLGEKEQAVRVLGQALERGPANREIRMALLGMYREAGDLDAARLHAGILQRRNPGNREIQALWESLQMQ